MELRYKSRRRARCKREPGSRNRPSEARRFWVLQNRDTRRKCCGPIYARDYACVARGPLARIVSETMETLRLPANDDAAVEHAAQIIRAGGLVAFPTETVYVLGGNALDAATVMKIFKAKERPAWDPLIVHLGSREMLEPVILKPTAQFDKLFAAFMPGPLTVVLLKNALVPDVVTAGRNTVALRFPAHPVAQRLIAASALPLAAPSANRFQRVSPTTADHVLADLDGRIDAVLDGGPCPIGVESTALDLTGPVPLILRQGAVTPEQLRQVLGEVAMSGSDGVSRPQEGRPSLG